MSRIGNYNKALDNFMIEKFIKDLEYKLSKTNDSKLRNSIKAKLKALKGDKNVLK